MDTQFKHREFRDDEFWKEIPGWKNISKEEFGNHLWQSKNSLKKIEQIKDVLGDRLTNEVYQDLLDGQKRTPMNIRITPYIFSLIDWNDPLNDPIRQQFLPMGSQFIEEHPLYFSDSLAEDTDSPTTALTHRYPDKVLFLTTAVCPVYCSYCTRSRLVGGSTDTKEKETFGSSYKHWDDVFNYIKNTPSVEDVVISGGDIFMLSAKHLKEVGEKLLQIENVRRIRFATKGIAVWPQKVLTDDEWFNNLVAIKKLGKSLGKQVVIHTHFSSPKELTIWSRMAMDRLFSEDIIVRNQAVLQDGINNDIETMVTLTRKLGYINIQPYYIYLHDMVDGCEHLRTTVAEAQIIDKAVRGTTAGFNTPLTVCDAPGGGGKRNIFSHDYYNRETGISIWTAPEVKPGKYFLYFDPIHKLSPEIQKQWMDEAARNSMLKEAIAKAGF